MTLPADIAWAAVGLSDGSQLTFARAPKLGQCLMTDTLAAQILAAVPKSPTVKPLDLKLPSIVVSIPTPVIAPVSRPKICITPSDNIAEAFADARAGDTVGFARGQQYRTRQPIKPTADGVTVTAFGEGAAPILWADHQAFWLANRAGWTFSGLELAGIAPLGMTAGLMFEACDDVTVADCTVRNFAFGASFNPHPQTGRRCGGETLVRGNRFAWNYSLATVSGGPYAGGDARLSSGAFFGGVDDLTLKGNVFDSNGWQPAGAARATIYNHGAYVRGDCGPATVTGNLFANNSSHGLQARSGGDITGNLFAGNAIGLSIGLVNGHGPLFAGGVRFNAEGNIFLGGRDIDGEVRSYAVEIGNTAVGRFANNLIADGAPKGMPAIKLQNCQMDADYAGPADVGIGTLCIQGNRVDWPTGNFAASGVRPVKLDSQADWGAPLKGLSSSVPAKVQPSALTALIGMIRQRAGIK